MIALLWSVCKVGLTGYRRVAAMRLGNAAHPAPAIPGGMLPRYSGLECASRTGPLSRNGLETCMALAAAFDRQSKPGPLVSAEGVAKSYGPVKALDRIDLHVDAGEFVALLGLNGAGKTTLFQLLSGL